MNRFALALLTLALPAQPLAAQQDPTPTEPPGLIERGADMFLRGIFDEFGPSLAELRPELDRLLSLMGDFRHYEMPERLPNGDILIRRKADAPPPPPLSPPLSPAVPDSTPEHPGPAIRPDDNPDGSIEL